MAAEGSDFAGVTDIDPALRVVSGRFALGQAIARRLSTPLGSLQDWPEYGYDLRDAIGTSVTDAQIRQRVFAQCMLEEEVENARVTVSREGDLVTVLISIIDGEGPFDFSVEVTELDVTAIIPAEA